VDVLLDGHDLTYAEVPGHAGTSLAVWIGFVVVTGGLWLSALALVLAAVNQWWMAQP
jgi:hypothetical protein